MRTSGAYDNAPHPVPVCPKALNPRVAGAKPPKLMPARLTKGGESYAPALDEVSLTHRSGVLFGLDFRSLERLYLWAKAKRDKHGKH